MHTATGASGAADTSAMEVLLQVPLADHRAGGVAVAACLERLFKLRKPDAALVADAEPKLLAAEQQIVVPRQPLAQPSFKAHALLDRTV